MDGSGTVKSAVSDYVVWVWDTQSLWSQAADKLKLSLSLSRARNASLALTITAAVFAAASAQVEKYWSTNSFHLAGCLSFAAALSMGVVTALQATTRRSRVEAWSRARAVSEAMKAETFMFLAGVGPYRQGDAVFNLRKNIERILADADDISDVTVGLVVR